MQYIVMWCVCWHILLLQPFSLAKSILMFKNYLTTAFRNIAANKFYTLINIIGLTTGLVVGLFILLWVQDEYSFDRFNKQANHIYKIQLTGGTGATKQIFTVLVAPVATFAKQELPEVKDAARIMNTGGNVPFSYKDKIFREDRVAFADPSLFSVFDFPLINGNQRKPFPDDASVVISRSVAQRYFGTENPVGKQIVMGHDELFNVSGVIDDMPDNSSIHYDILIPLSRYNRLAYQEGTVSYNGTGRIASMDADWSRFSFETYLLLKPETDIALLEKKLQKIHERNKPEDAPVPYLAQPLSDVHLYKADGNDGGISTVRIFSAVALLVLLVACINYVNLSTARSMVRAKEVSMRKIIGADKWQLFIQFMAETTVVFVIAALLAVLLMVLLLPYYNQVSGKLLVLQVKNVQAWLWLGGALIGTLAAASIYPALLLSSFRPMQALKGKAMAGIGNSGLRRALVIVQFSVSVILIIATLIIDKQMNYIRNKKLGYDKENVISFNMRYNMQPHYEAVKAELMSMPGITAVSRSGGYVVSHGGWTGDNDWEGKPASSNLLFHPFYADETTIPFLKIEMAEGSNFTGVIADSTHFIINETAAREMGIKNPVGKHMRVWQVNGIITGVVKDFHVASMRKKIEPVVFVYQPQNAERVYVKTTGAGAQQAIAGIQKVWKRYSGQVPLTYAFMDESYDGLYKSEMRVASLSRLFAAVTILLSCLGLLGLATFSAQVKTREIGIRKVLGASILGIIGLQAREFMLLVAVALGIGMPLAWWTMSHWLGDFAYRASMGWSVFILAATSALFIAFISVAFQSWKAALANPVKSLRNE